MGSGSSIACSLGTCDKLPEDQWNMENAEMCTKASTTSSTSSELHCSCRLNEGKPTLSVTMGASFGYGSSDPGLCGVVQWSNDDLTNPDTATDLSAWTSLGSMECVQIPEEEGEYDNVYVGTDLQGVIDFCDDMVDFFGRIADMMILAIVLGVLGTLVCGAAGGGMLYMGNKS